MNPTMVTILKIREQLIRLFKNYENVALFGVKLLMGLFIFANINAVGNYMEPFGGLVTFGGGIFYTAGLAALFAIAPPTAAHFIVLLAIMLQISLSLELMAIVFLIGVCILVFYCRIEPKKSYIITAMVLAYYLKMPYAVVLTAGLYAGFSAIIPVVIGAAVWSFLPMFGSLAGTQTAAGGSGLDVTQITDTLTNIATTMEDTATGNLQWVFEAFFFAMAIVLVYAVSRLTVNYAKELALGLGGFLCIFGGIMASSVGGSGANILGIIFFSILSVAAALTIRFFDIALDYKKVEYVEFEDEDSYYYVKKVQKMRSGETAPEIKRVLAIPSVPKRKPPERPAPARGTAAKDKARGSAGRTATASRVGAYYDVDEPDDTDGRYIPEYRPSEARSARKPAERSAPRGKAFKATPEPKRNYIDDDMDYDDEEWNR
ncbi:MAG: hypothetical protein LBS19_00985 [Clostridiales bacterium]|jgi:hypothetical protein|nr:hypothetical protein [Clostridiales bacterium]